MSTPCDKNRLLLVDDEPSIVRLFQIMLSAALPKMTIDTAGNGAEAVESFEKNRPCVVLMDMHMPVMDGRQAFKKIEELCRDRDQAMPSVIFCTGYAPSDWVKEVTAEQPCHSLLHKPVSGSDIVKTVQRFLPA